MAETNLLNPSPARVYRYQLVVDADDYTLMTSLADLAQSSLQGDRPDGRIIWVCREDEEIRP